MRWHFDWNRCVVLLLALMSATQAASKTIEAEFESQLSPAVRQRLASYRQDAMKGNLQAMRNMAKAWSHDAVGEVPQALVVGCAWHQAIAEVHTALLNSEDKSSSQTACNGLSPAQLEESNTVKQRLLWAIVRK